RQRRPAVDFRLPAAQEIEIRAVEDIYRQGALWGWFGHDSSGSRWTLRPYNDPLGRRKHQSRMTLMALHVTINGEGRQIEGPLSVGQLLAGLGLDPAKIAVERNLEIVPRSLFGAVTVGEGDRLEIVHFI